MPIIVRRASVCGNQKKGMSSGTRTALWIPGREPQSSARKPIHLAYVGSRAEKPGPPEC